MQFLSTKKWHNRPNDTWTTQNGGISWIRRHFIIFLSNLSADKFQHLPGMSLLQYDWWSKYLRLLFRQPKNKQNRPITAQQFTTVSQCLLSKDVSTAATKISWQKVYVTQPILWNDTGRLTKSVDVIINNRCHWHHMYLDVNSVALLVHFHVCRQWYVAMSTEFPLKHVTRATPITFRICHGDK